MTNRFIIATFIASLAIQASVLATDEARPKVYVLGSSEASDHIDNHEINFDDEVDTPNEQVEQVEEIISKIFDSPTGASITLNWVHPELYESHECKTTTCSKCSNPFQILMKRIALGFAIYNISHGAITLANTVGPCVGTCAANVASDFGWGAFQLLGALA